MALAKVACVGYRNAWPLTHRLDPERFEVTHCVPSEAARLLREGAVDVGPAGPTLRRQRGKAHEDAGGAEAALRAVMVDERLLYRMQRVAVFEALDGDDFLDWIVGHGIQARRARR